MPFFHGHVSVAVSVSVAKYVRITFIRKNSVAYVKKITFSISVSSPLPFIRSYRIEFYFSVPAVRTRLELRPLFCAENSAPCLLGLPRYCCAHAPAATDGNGYGNGYGSGYVTVEISHKPSATFRKTTAAFRRQNTRITTKNRGLNCISGVVLFSHYIRVLLIVCCMVKGVSVLPTGTASAAQNRTMTARLRPASNSAFMERATTCHATNRDRYRIHCSDSTAWVKGKRKRQLQLQRRCTSQTGPILYGLRQWRIICNI